MCGAPRYFSGNSRNSLQTEVPAAFPCPHGFLWNDACQLHTGSFASGETVLDWSEAECLAEVTRPELALVNALSFAKLRKERNPSTL